ncbi:FeoA family protein [Denitrovibrio acetiphilus DSM 12809]|uniref:FeoA family protein n=2 Tax=Denitrovibrio TaxID=117999 RepID=D4H711_DENA2|nr:FeoA family protein [Denitrovibrio acetiphilus DSM 12809]
MHNICCEAPAAVKENVMPLSMLEPGSRGIVKNFVMNCEDHESCRFVRRLKEIGLFHGARFEVLKNDGTGQLSVSCEGTTLALGRGMADKINVEVLNGSVMSGNVFGKFCRRFGIKCRP